MKQWFKEGIIFSLFYQIVLLLTVGLFIVLNQPQFSAETMRKIWGAWDGDHYVYLAEHGYTDQGDPANFIAFYPLYPLLIGLVTLGVRDGYLSAILVTTIASIVGHALFYVVLRQLHFPFWKSIRILLLFFLNPATVYFTHIYTEGVFLLFTCASLFFLYRKNVVSSALVASLSSATRLVGVTIGIVYFFDNIEWRQKSLHIHWRNVAWTALIPLGFMVYLFINWWIFKDPFHYQTVLSANWYKEAVNPITKYIEEVQSFRIFNQVSPLTSYLDTLTTLITPFFFLFYSILKFAHRKRSDSNHYISWSWIVWGMSTWLIIASQSYWLSNLRYIALLLPLYPILEHLTWIFKPVYVLLLIVFGFLALYGIDIFTKAGWLY